MIYCSRCGVRSAQEGQSWCDGCVKRYEESRIDRYVCGVCHKQAETAFVHGYRCRKHFGVREPSSRVTLVNKAGQTVAIGFTGERNA